MRLGFRAVMGCLMLLQLCYCSKLPASAGTISASVVADGKERIAHLNAGSTVSDALKQMGIELGTQDKVDPPGYSLLTNGSRITVTRVTERLETEEIIIPFERQIIRNETIPEGEMRLIQPGKTGKEEITYRIVEEDSDVKTRVAINRTLVEAPVYEIMMVGAQKSYVPVLFAGSMAYLSAGNAWLIDGSTGNRRPLLLSGDLDGRVFRLSPDHRWLLCTRRAPSDEAGINSLWIIDTQSRIPEPIDLQVENIIHFADWSPSSPSASNFYSIAYSTVEPRSAPPGWQANNDLHLLIINYYGTIINHQMILDANPGGQYGWWGTTFSWDPGQGKFSYARPDGIGLVNRADGTLQSLAEITPYQTQGDWAWVPPFSWSPDGKTLFFIQHGKSIGLESPEASPVFNLMSFSEQTGFIGPLAQQVGMFASIACSAQEYSLQGEAAYQLAYLTGIFPLESQSSNYRLVVMDRDGSNRHIIFPPEDKTGVNPGSLLWSPGGDQIAILYQQDLWIIDTESGLSQQVTADGQAIAFDWKP
jgi:hypothetical protein